MKNKIGGIAVVVASLIAFQSYSKQDAYRTIEDCTALLPQGHQFSVNIEASIDTTSGLPQMSGAFNMSDGTQAENAELSAKIEPFKQCVLGLIK